MVKANLLNLIWAHKTSCGGHSTWDVYKYTLKYHCKLSWWVNALSRSVSLHAPYLPHPLAILVWSLSWLYLHSSYGILLNVSMVHLCCTFPLFRMWCFIFAHVWVGETFQCTFSFEILYPRSQNGKDLRNDIFSTLRTWISGRYS